MTDMLIIKHIASIHTVAVVYGGRIALHAFVVGSCVVMFTNCMMAISRVHSLLFAITTVRLAEDSPLSGRVGLAHLPLLVLQRQRRLRLVEHGAQRQMLQLVGCVGFVVVLVLAVEKGDRVLAVRLKGCRG